MILSDYFYSKHDLTIEKVIKMNYTSVEQYNINKLVLHN